MAAEHIRVEEFGNGLLVLTLNRPDALNACDVAMLDVMRRTFTRCRDASHIRAVLLQGAGERAFCVGGDVNMLSSAISFDAATDAPKEHMFQQYNLLFEMRQFGKPIVSLLDGLTMGAGVGLATSSLYVVTTEATRLAMPECNIGLVPDNAFAHVAANSMPPGVGRLLAFTGCQLTGAGDLLVARLATHHVSRSKLPAFQAAIRTVNLSGDPDAAVRGALADHAELVPEQMNGLVADAPLLRAVAMAGNLAQLRSALAEAAPAGGWAVGLMAGMQRGAPLSQALTWQLFQMADADTAKGLREEERVAAALEREYAVMSRLFYRRDFAEGVKAMGSKGGMPAWRPAAEDQVSADEIVASLQPLPGDSRLSRLRLSRPHANSMFRVSKL